MQSFSEKKRQKHAVFYHAAQWPGKEERMIYV